MAGQEQDYSFLNNYTKYSDVILAVAVMVILAVMIIPLPATLLDLLLTCNITFSLIILMVAMYTLEPLQFSVFPGLLLIITLYRLALNISSTRLILGEAYAGQVINAFGSFVVKGNYVVGTVIFLILVVIQFVVITKGAGRIAEVAARFTLDAMPGKQMSIDADLNAGLIDDREAMRRREKIAREADFYGAMDGASKFVRGDAIAGLIITVINILGGFIIGVVQLKMPFTQALQTYTILTVGDGLVSQIPALIISIAAGIIITRAASESNLGQDVTRQILTQPRALFIVAAVIFFFGITPGLPTIPFFILSALVGTLAYMTNRAQKSHLSTTTVESEIREKPGEEKIETYLQVDPVELEIGYGLIPLVDEEQGGDLLQRITTIRKQCALELGIVIPPIRIRDNIQLKLNEYLIKIKGVEMARSEIMPDSYLALNPGTVEEEIEGMKTVEPAFGLPALWIPHTKKEEAELAGYTVVEVSAVMTTHLQEILKAHAHEILGRQQVQNLLDTIKKDYPTVIEELIPNLLTVGAIQKVLQNLLKEKVPIRDLVTILETLADYAPLTKDTDILTEYVRKALFQTIYQSYQTEGGSISAITLDPQLEQIILSAFKQTKTWDLNVVLHPDFIKKLYTELSAKVEMMTSHGLQPVVVCSPGVRLYVRKLIEPVMPHLAVLSLAELPPNVEIQSIGMVVLSDEN